jgi:murein DD-endopeptidase MepM/ murein hydrolase activator NlpD
MQAAINRLIARFPERSLIIRSGSETQYFTLKTWHQITLISTLCVVVLWTLIASIGFSFNRSALLETRAELIATISENEAFIAQLEADQRNAYELRQNYKAEQSKNATWRNQFAELRSISSDVIGVSAPDRPDPFIQWLDGQLKTRITRVETENLRLSTLVMDLSESVAEISGHTPPTQLNDVNQWLGEVAGDLTNAYTTQTEAMQTLHESMTQSLQRAYATIEQTPLANAEIAGFSPSYGIGGPERPQSVNGHVFESFESKINQLQVLSRDWKQLNQLFECTPLATPVDYYNLTSKFGNRKDPFNGRPDWHEGVDLAAWPGMEIRATAAGTVRHAGNRSGYGNLVVIDHGCGIQTAYGHMKTISVEKGQVLSYRDVIGYVGSTGRSTGPHVHYEVRVQGEPVDPYQFIEAGRYVFKKQALVVADAN